MSTQLMNRRRCGASAVVDVPREHPCADGAEGNVVLPLLSARPFDFDGVSASSSVELVVADAIDTSGFDDGILDVRLHQGSIGAKAKIEVLAYVVAPTAEDPAQTFRAASEAAAVVMAQTTVAAPGGTLTAAALSGQLGSFVSVVVRGTQGNATDECNAILSADLVLRRRHREHLGGTKVVMLPRTRFDYTSLPPLATGSMVLVRALDVSDYRTGTLALRVHERSIGASARLNVQIYGALPDPTDPSTSFIVPTSDREHSFVVEPGTNSEVQTVRLPSGFGPFLYVRLEAAQSPSGGELSAAISLDFVGQQ